MRSSEITFSNNWSPFRTVLHKPDNIRPLTNPEGVADRLRVVAFAELQARDAFLWGAERFPEAPEHWRADWLRFAEVEDRHAQMLLSRMAELGVSADARTVSDKLTRLCRKAEDPVSFLFLLASAEERGMEAGSILGKQMQAVDAVSAALFAQIADEEVEHVASAKAALEGQCYDTLRERARAISAAL
jgi:uncharacterized ferritin-like protein (DUF455 family)